jgi:hypothetical protein
MSQGANQSTEANQPGVPAPERPTADESRRWLDQQVWALPLWMNAALTRSWAMAMPV